jgi:hypothetical protein
MRRSRFSRWVTLASAALCLTAIGCHQGGGIGAAAAASNNSGAVTVKVVNHSWMDVTIYLLQGTHRDRIGVATATSTTEFHVSLRLFSAGAEYQLYGDPIGSRQTVRSERLHAQDGDLVTWTLEDDLARSSIDVR